MALINPAPPKPSKPPNAAPFKTFLNPPPLAPPARPPMAAPAMGNHQAKPSGAPVLGFRVNPPGVIASNILTSIGFI